MPYPFTTIPDLRDFIIATYTANGMRLIDGIDGHDALLGILDLISPELRADLIVQLGPGGSLGGVSTGDTLADGTLLEDVLRAILIKTIHPTYVLPTSVLSSSIVVLSQELGALISPILSEVYTTNDAGSAITHQLKKNGVNLSSVLPYTDVAVSISGTPTSYQITTSYNQGPCKNNNLGALDCVGRVIAGNAPSNTIVYTGYRKTFFGTPATTPASSANVRALAGGVLNLTNGSQFTILITAGAQKVSFAYPASLEDVASVTFREMGGIEVKGNFTQTTVSVEGDNAFAATSYKVYTYTPVEPFPFDAKYDVTI